MSKSFNDNEKRQNERGSKPKHDRSRDLLKPQKQSFFGSLWSSFIAGVVVVAPISITVAITYWFVTGPMTKLDTFVKNFLPAGDSTVETLTRAIPGFGILIAFIAIIILGASAKNFFGRAFINAGENILDTLPVVRNLYRFFKNVFETALQQSDRSFKEVALIQYPRPGVWAIAFVVGKTKGEISNVLDDQGPDMTSVFIPTGPNPTSGFLLFLPRSEMRPLEMSVEDAAKAVFSLGLVLPDLPVGDEALRRLEEAAANAMPIEKKKRRIFGR
ncbi:MAG: DUF502 domain-containing protein [Pseudomonadota bacterium]